MIITLFFRTDGEREGWTSLSKVVFILCSKEFCKSPSLFIVKRLKEILRNLWGHSTLLCSCKFLLLFRSWGKHFVTSKISLFSIKILYGLYQTKKLDFIKTKKFHPTYSDAFKNYNCLQKMSLGKTIAAKSGNAKCVLIKILKKFGFGAQKGCF